MRYLRQLLHRRELLRLRILSRRRHLRLLSRNRLRRRRLLRELRRPDRARVVLVLLCERGTQAFEPLGLRAPRIDQSRQDSWPVSLVKSYCLP
jgi:hypothetical protein